MLPKKAKPASSSNLRRRTLFVCFVFLAAQSAAAPQDGRARSPENDNQGERRIISIGDIHGAYDPFVAILIRAGLIDQQQQWTGGKTVFVQTGDYTDRGSQVRKVLDLLMALEPRIKSGGGEFVPLLGNHEVLNIIGDLRYVTKDIAAAFADGQSDARRQDAWSDYERLAAARVKAGRSAAVYQQTRDAWMEAHPPGWLEYREALSARGKYGRWMRTKPVAAEIDGTIFMHAGISPDHPATVSDVNTRAREEMARYETYLQRLVDAKLALRFFTLPEVLDVSAAELQAASAVIEAAKAKGEAPDLSGFDVALLREAQEITRMNQWSLLAGEGPLWFRGYANWAEDDTTTPKVNALLDKLGVKRIVVAHTPQKEGRIVSRFHGRVFVTDTGMLASVYQGRPSALQIRGAEVSAIYEDGVVPLSPSSAPQRMLVR